MKLVSDRVQRKATLNLRIFEKAVLCAFSAWVGAISANYNSSVDMCLCVEPYLWPLNVFPLLRSLYNFFISYILVAFVMNSIRHFTLHCFHSIIFQTNQPWTYLSSYCQKHLSCHLYNRKPFYIHRLFYQIYIAKWFIFPGTTLKCLCKVNTTLVLIKMSQTS